jgi:hypothetical protein
MAAARRLPSVVVMTQTSTVQPGSTPFRRLLPVFGLLLLAPFSGEYLLGNLSLRILPALLFLIPLYGGGALLIREITRRTGRGWPTMLVLGLAYGVLEAGIIDASMFNSHYEGLEFTGARVPGLDFSAYFALAFVVNHAVLSIGAPIALAEALVPARRHQPWLGPVGLAVTALLYLAGGLLVGFDSRSTEHFQPSPWQLTSAVLTVIALVATARVLPGPEPVPTRPAPAVVSTAPSPLRAGILVAVVSGIFFFAPPNYPGVVFGLLLIAGTAALIVRWSRAPGWTERQVIALAAGALFTSACGAFVVGAFTHQTDPITQVGHVIFGLATLVLVRYCLRRQTPFGAQGLAQIGAKDGI